MIKAFVKKIVETYSIKPATGDQLDRAMGLGRYNPEEVSISVAGKTFQGFAEDTFVLPKRPNMKRGNPLVDTGFLTARFTLEDKASQGLIRAGIAVNRASVGFDFQPTLKCNYCETPLEHKEPCKNCGCEEHFYGVDK